MIGSPISYNNADDATRLIKVKLKFVMMMTGQKEAKRDRGGGDCQERKMMVAMEVMRSKENGDGRGSRERKEAGQKQFRKQMKIYAGERKCLLPECICPFPL